MSAHENLSEDASGILMESVLEGMAEYYSAELSQKIRRGISLAVENHQFIGGVVPLGYKLTADKKYEIDHATAPIVRRIFKLYASGHSLKETGAKVIDEYGIEIGNVYNYIGKILENRNYIGTYTRGGYSAENAMPRIVDDALFDKVQIMRNKKKKTPATARAYVEYLLTTKIFCGYCREMMVGTGGTSKSGKVHHYYGCKNYINKKGCKKKNVKKDYIEHFVISKAREQLTENNIALIAKVVHEASKRDGNAHAINDIKRKLKENAKAIENLLIAIETGEHMDLLSQRITDKQTEKANLEKSLAIEMMNQDEIPELDIKFFLHQLKSAKVDDADCNRALIAIFVNAIYLYDDKATLIFNASDKPAGVDFALVDEIEKLNKGEKIEGGRCSYMMQRTPLMLLIIEPTPYGVGSVFIWRCTG